MVPALRKSDAPRMQDQHQSVQLHLLWNFWKVREFTLAASRQGTSLTLHRSAVTVTYPVWIWVSHRELAVSANEDFLDGLRDGL